MDSGYEEEEEREMDMGREEMDEGGEERYGGWQ